MWPGWHFNQEINAWYGHYVEDRVAFRETAVRFYMDATYAVFGEFSEDLHMYGKDGEVFPADDGYIRAYQHLATDEELMDACKEFEAYFMEQVMKEMIKTTKLDGEDESSNTMVDYFKDTAIADLAKESTDQNSLGLAQMLYEQMKRNTGSV